MGLLGIFFGDVEMPDRVESDLISGGVKAVRGVIEAENRRREEERRRAEEEERRREEERRARGEEPESDTKFYHTRGSRLSPEELARWSRELPKGMVVAYGDGKRHPPDLKADVLTFSARLLKYVREKCDGRGVVAYKRAGIDRRIYSRIVSDNVAMVDKRTALQFCLGLQLERYEADILLKSAGYALSGTIPSDCAFAYCIEHAIYNLKDVNLILSQCGLETITIPGSVYFFL